MTESTEKCNCEETVRVPLIGDKAPAFKATTTQGPMNFPEDYAGKWVILFSHPADFTPVCTTEFITFASLQEEFRTLNCELVGVSVDSIHSHIAWLRAIKEKIEFRGLKNVDVKFPVVADLKMDVAKKYGMIQPNVSDTAAVRAVFFIDPNSVIRALIYYPASAGRNFDEIKRLLIALQTADKNKVATPADWRPGQPVIVPAPNTIGKANDRVAEAAKAGYDCKDWFLCFKNLSE
ncbi:MAG: Alkyl hydroperoxide reductase subunit C [Firmicutes bacterium ADurb.Bin506]|jgi:peroxiredoxin (alkyl hydroperoxide reductase subunit C)|nr:MAG: Alkyl hydroperoxide reductase subunit C [Firmicutes bacterium ADurb.Bin506]